MAEDFIRKWLDLPNKDPKKLSQHGVVNDRWDRKFYAQMLEQLDQYMVNHEMFCNHVSTGEPMWGDLFWLLWKVDPEHLDTGQVSPDHLINLLVGKESAGLNEFRRLRYFSEGDDVAAAMAACDLREPVEGLFDKLEKLKEALEKVMHLMKQMALVEQEQRDLDEMVEDWKSGHNPDEEISEQLQQQIDDTQGRMDDLREAMEQAGDEVESEADAAKVVIASELKDPLAKAADMAENIHNQQDLWGDEAGSLQRRPAEERMRLARRLQNPRFKHLLDLIGPMRRIMEESQLRKVDFARDEVYRITMGDDIERVLPSELAKLHHPLAKYEFYKKYLEKSLPQYDMRGKERVGKGKIIACLDNSGSMLGEKEMFGKAVAICALHLARKQKRSFYGIHFGAAREIKTFDFGLEEDFSVEKVLAYVEYFFNGGTDFMRPLSLALDELVKEHEATGKVNGDIMFITDGLCQVTDSWMKLFKEEQKRLDFKVWGFLIGGLGRDADPLSTICDGRVFTVQDLLDPTDTRSMFTEL